MSKSSVYLETSFLSALVDMREHPISRAQRQQSLEWWEKQRSDYELFCSQAVVYELSRESFPGQEHVLALTEKLRLLPITPEVEGVVEVYRKNLVMPAGGIGDATHLAIASVYSIDYLLTWNCKHLANANKIKHIEAINRRIGLVTPFMLTPPMLLKEIDDAATEEI